MVKGVNRTVIEVHNTGSKYFEKIVFYVTPEYGNLSSKQLEQASAQVLPLFSQTLQSKPVNALRNRCLKKKKRRIVRAAVLCSVAIGVIVAAVLLF